MLCCIAFCVLICGHLIAMPAAVVSTHYDGHYERLCREVVLALVFSPDDVDDAHACWPLRLPFPLLEKIFPRYPEPSSAASMLEECCAKPSSLLVILELAVSKGPYS